MSDNRKDLLRKAAGLPTTSEEDVAAQKKLREQQEWDAKQPDRERYAGVFTSRFDPIIAEWLKDAQSVAEQKHHRIEELQMIHAGGGGPANPFGTLKHRVFNIAFYAVGQPRSQIQRPTHKGQLEFSLKPDGVLTWSARRSAAQTAIIGNGGGPIETLEPEEVVSAGFQALLAALKQ